MAFCEQTYRGLKNGCMNLGLALAGEAGLASSVHRVAHNCSVTPVPEDLRVLF